ncbi:XRE family transcriptional regulator [Fluviispira vulneris]|uniref:XRE family transcriptional regulator n=1 Tax=Fluviispira vulneris TaxID=2763012 RepID=UPI00164630FC|nr:XRE family transcriptional regulator [Fluviispira vulneris]
MSDASKRLKFLRDEIFNLSLKDFCNKFNLSYNYMRNIECGEKSLPRNKSIEITKKIQEYGFNISDEWIETGRGSCPISSFSVLKTNKYINFDDTNNEQRQWLKTILTRIFPYKYACISSNEMMPFLKNGDIVFGVKGDPVKNLTRLNNEIVIARIDDNYTYVRRLKVYENDIFLVADNKEGTDDPIIKVNKINWISGIIIHKKHVGKIELLENEND